jgi:LmbE family N-acetylglucosaminyl deacetylase
MRDKGLSTPTDELVALVSAAKPEVIYTHNLCDKHPTHVGVAVRVVNACRQLPAEERPKVWGCEVWRDLDWMVDSDKVLLDCTGRDNLQSALLGVFDSQVSGGKRYDLATLGRRRAHATYWESHEGDSAELLNFAMDLTPLVMDPDLCFKTHVKGYMDRFFGEVATLIGNVTD